MRAVTYRRVSTGKQVESGLSLDDQGGRWHPSTIAHVARSVALDTTLAALAETAA